MASLAQAEPDTIVLAREPALQLGPMTVTPALRQVGWDGGTRTLEPRVMQVLVALAREPGTIISRDALVAQCWSGRIVGENAIQRVISLLRQLALESGAFTIETITKVGYRLLVESAPAPPTDHEPTPSHQWVVARRKVLAGCGALGLVGGSLALWGPDAQARRAAQRFRAAGIDAQRRGGPQNIRQAVRYFEQAVATDSDFVDGWADLALARQQLMTELHEDQHEAIARQIKGAADRALQLDPRAKNALVALALYRPVYRRWAEAERQLAATLEVLPAEPLLLQRQALLLSELGRWAEAAKVLETVAHREPLVPDHQVRRATALWHAGQPGSAAALFDRAARVWPVEPMVWLARFNFLLLGGRAAEALAMTERVAVGTGGLSPVPTDVALSTARALASPTRARTDRAVQTIMTARERRQVASFFAIPYLVALDARDRAWPLLFDYYLGYRDKLTGERVRLSPVAIRRTHFLFTRTMAPLRQDPRFAVLADTSGLVEYWRASGRRPDQA